MAWSRRSRAVLLAGWLATGVVRASAGEPAPGASDWLGAPRETPIADSIAPAVERYVREHFSPCAGTDDGVPCFPVTVQVKGRVYSVRETFDHMEPSYGPVPGSLPTHSEMIQQGANPHPTSASVGFDPKTIVCKTRQLLKKVQGRSTTYYLYRVWDETGERAVLRDTPLDPEGQTSPHFHYVSLGEFGDECEAVKAYLTSTREVRRRRENLAADEGGEPGLKLRSGDLPD